MIYLLSSQKRRQGLIFDAELPFWPGKWGKTRIFGSKMQRFAEYLDFIEKYGQIC